MRSCLLCELIYMEIFSWYIILFIHSITFDLLSSSVFIFIVLFGEFFTTALTDGLSLEHEWQQVFSVFRLISTMLLFRRSPFDLLFPSPPVPVTILWLLSQEQQLQLVSPSLSCSTVFFSFLAKTTYLSFFSLSFSFTQWSAGTTKSSIRQVVFLGFFFFFFFFFFDYR